VYVVDREREEKESFFASLGENLPSFRSSTFLVHKLLSVRSLGPGRRGVAP